MGIGKLLLLPNSSVKILVSDRRQFDNIELLK